MCESYGTRRRTIQCVWYGTKKAAGEVCKDLPPPIVIKSCRVAACPQSSVATADVDSMGTMVSATSGGGRSATSSLSSLAASLSSNKRNIINQLIYTSVQGKLSVVLLGSLVSLVIGHSFTFHN